MLSSIINESTKKQIENTHKKMTNPKSINQRKKNPLKIQSLLSNKMLKNLK